MKLLLKIMYDGGAYAGYQAQPTLPSIQVTLTNAVSAALGFPCSVTGCSRTDAGVHALGFSAAIEPIVKEREDWLPMPIGKFHRALRRHLPPDIAVCGEAAVSDDLHPRYSVISKEYRYRMYDGVADNPFLRGRAWHLSRRITEDGLKSMKRAGEYLVGRHDFTSFMAAGSKITDAVRTISYLTVAREGDMVELAVRADGFLYNMVRIITGTLVDCAYGSLSADEIPTILHAANRSLAGRTAPAHGLYLSDVTYDREIAWILN